MGQKLSVVYYFENRFKKLQSYNEYTILAIVIWTLMSDKYFKSVALNEWV